MMRERRPGARAIGPTGSTPLVPMQTVMPAALGALLRGTPLSDGKIAFAWRTAVGAGVDRASDVRLGADGRLEVTAADPRWQREIRRAIPIIVPRLNALLGSDVVRTVAVTIDRARERPHAEARSGPSS